MEDVHIDDSREARRLLVTAFETIPAEPATAGDGLLGAVRRRQARRRRTRALVSAGAVAAAAGTAAVTLLSATVATPPALAAVTGALSRASTESFRMSLTITGTGQAAITSPLYVTGKLDLKRNLGEETLSNGWRTVIVGHEAYTKILPDQAATYGTTTGKLWTQELVSDSAPPASSTGAQIAWDFNSDRPFNPQALLALIESGAKVHDEGSVSGPGWTGTRYTFSLSHPQHSLRLVDSITGTVDVDRHGHVRGLTQTTAFAAGGQPGAAAGMTYTLDFTFSDFGLRFSVTPPPASQVDPDLGVGVQF